MIGRYRSVQAYFASVVEDATRHRGIEAHHDVRAYLAHLLERFGSARGGRWLGEPLALLWSRAESEVMAQRSRRFRELGDHALLLDGFFTELYERRGVAASYVRAVGRSAYRRSASLSGAPARTVLEQLATRFAEWSTLLEEVRARTALGSDVAVEDLVARWMLSPSPRNRARLLRRGLVPIRGLDTSQ